MIILDSTTGADTASFLEPVALQLLRDGVTTPATGCGFATRTNLRSCSSPSRLAHMGSALSEELEVLDEVEHCRHAPDPETLGSGRCVLAWASIIAVHVLPQEVVPFLPSPLRPTPPSPRGCVAAARERGVRQEPQNAETE